MPKTRSSAPTLADVARRAGVSQATASRVLSHSPHPVTPALRERVLAAARELNFLPNAHAQALTRPSRFRTIGVIVHDVKDPYFAEVAGGILHGAAAAGQLVMLCNSYRRPDRELEYIELLRAQRVTAIIMAASGLDDREYAEQLASQLVPFQSTGGRVAFIGRHHVAGDAILPDNVGGARQLAQHLIGLGHREVGVISGPPLLTTTRDRLSGFTGALRQAGVELAPDRIVYGDFTRDSGAAAALELLDRHPDLTAIFAMNDQMAIGALAALHQRGVPVPEQVSVAGFDDIPSSRDVTPALTTVRVPMAEMGQRAFELTLESARSELRIEHLPCDLIPRASTAPPPARPRRAAG